MALALLSPVAARATQIMRCEHGVVEAGTSSKTVIARCGQPAHRDSQLYPLRPGSDGAQQVEVWTYNFGPGRMLYLLSFRAGKLVRVRSHGYGIAASAKGRCNPYQIVPGMTEYELVLRCGQPESSKSASLLAPVHPAWPRGRVRRLPNGVYAAQGGYARPVYRQHWVYNFGSGYLKRKVTLENGVVTDVETGGRGN